jgi:hypothetical protein
MARTSWLVALVAALLLGLTAGCSSSGERGKNKDRDRPVPPADKKG